MLWVRPLAPVRPKRQCSRASRASIPLAARALFGRTPSTSSAVLGWAGGGEEVDEQFVDALGLVVMDPVRRVGQALDAVEVGHVLVVGLGELGAEVAIALPPDDQGGRRDRVKLLLGPFGVAPRRGSSRSSRSPRRAATTPRRSDRSPRSVYGGLGVAQEVLEELASACARTWCSGSLGSWK